MIQIDQKSLNGDSEYRWDRPYRKGWTEAVINRCREYHNQKSGKTTIHTTFGVAGPEGGVNIDSYVPTSGERLRRFLEAFAPEYLKGGSIDPPTLVGRRGSVEIDEEWSEEQQRNRPVIKGFRPLPGGAKAAQATTVTEF